MPIPSGFINHLTVPDLVVGCCRSGMVGTVPALNQRTSEAYAGGLDEISGRLGPQSDAFLNMRDAKYVESARCQRRLPQLVG